MQHQLLPFSCCAFKQNGRVTIWDRTRLCPPYDVITFLKQNSTRVIDQTDHAHFFHVWTCMRSSCRNVRPTGPTHDLLPAARPVLVKMSQAFFGRPRSKSVWSSQHFTDVMSNVSWSCGVSWWHPARLAYGFWKLRRYIRYIPTPNWKPVEDLMNEPQILKHWYTCKIWMWHISISHHLYLSSNLYHIT